MNEPIDLTGYTWHKLSEAGTSHGSLYKVTLNYNGKTYFLKLSMIIGKEVVGHESINEVIVSRLLDVLKLPHTRYDLIVAKIKIKDDIFVAPICVSESFVHDNETAIPLEEYCTLRNVEPLVAMKTLGFQEYLDRLFAVDFLIANRDRHGYNIELLQNTGRIYPAPLFDNGFSFVAPLQNDIDLIQAFNPMRDVVTNNYIGSQSLYDNLKQIEQPLVVSPLTKQSRRYIFYKLSSFVSKEHLDKIWDIIWMRYHYLLDNGYIQEVSAETSIFT